MAKSQKKRGGRGPGRLATLTYAQLAEWSGLSLGTVQTYGSSRVFDPYSIDSALCWVNTRRRKLGLPLIGQPTEPPPTKGVRE